MAKTLVLIGFIGLLVAGVLYTVHGTAAGELSKVNSRLQVALDAAEGR